MPTTGAAAENAAVIEARYRKLGGEIQVIHKPGVGHHPHGLDDPAPVVKFIVARAAGEIEVGWAECNESHHERSAKWWDSLHWPTLLLQPTVLTIRRTIMPDYRRWYVPGGTFFFTVVTCERRRFLTEERARNSLRKAVEEVRKKLPFEIIAMVLLPDHLHTIWTLPTGDSQYPLRWKRIKELFTTNYLAAGGSEVPPNASRQCHGERGIWQRRYWEHAVEDEDDLKGCGRTTSIGTRRSMAMSPTCAVGSGPRSIVSCKRASIRWSGEQKIRAQDMMLRSGANERQ